MTQVSEIKRDAFLSTLQDRPLVMGILNVTPDSFSDGGQFNAPEAARAHAHQMAREGADIIDIGGESTRPGSAPVSEEEELNRVIPIIKAATETDKTISIDSYKANVARSAVKAGATIINDVWGCQRDPEMAATAAETGAALIVMHNRTEADPNIDIMDDVLRFLEHSIKLATDAGVPEVRIITDPGIGFGKTPEQSLICLNRLEKLHELGQPVLLGLSRKRFIGHVLGNEVTDRANATLACNTLGLTKGANILRVHDVAPHVEAVKLFRATKASS